MVGILLGFFILYLCFSSGRSVLGLLRLGGINRDEELVMGTVLGLGLLSYVVLLLGLLHILTFWWLWAVVSLFSVTAVIKVHDDLQVLRDTCRSWTIPPGLFNKIIFALGGLTLLVSLAGLLAPDTANDSLCYHLHLPKIFLSHQAVGPVPYEWNALFPFLMEMLFTLGLGVYGVTLAQFFHFATGILTALGILAFARRRVPIQYAWWGAILFITTPVVVNQFTTTYVDVGLACFTWFALMATFRWGETKGTGWVLLAGIFSGFALSIKFLGLISVTCMFLMVLWGIRSEKGARKNRLRPLWAFCAGAFFFSAYWYLRSYLELGNPVYPYFAQVFGTGNFSMNYDDIGFPKTWLNFFLSPWRMTMSPEKFEGFGVHIGPAYLAFLPLGLVTIRKVRNALGLTLFSIYFFGSWFLLGQDMRFFIPALPGLTVLMAFGFSGFDKPDLAGKGMRLLLVAALCFSAALAFYHFRGSFKLALGLETRDAYLARVERSYPVARFVNKNLSSGSKILAADEIHLFYFERPIVRESVYARDTHYAERSKSPREALRLLANDGFTHILAVGCPYRSEAVELDLLGIPRSAKEARSRPAPDLELLYNEKFNEANGRIWDYRLYKIKKGTN